MSAMEEWQRRMKAEKDAERQKKHESADILRNFRGGDSEEAKKLKAAKEEERKKKDEAQKALQGYKGSDVEEVRKLKAQKEEEMKKKMDAQSMLHDYKAKELDELKIKKRDVQSNNHQQLHEGLTPVNRGEGTSNEEEIPSSISVSERAAWLASMATRPDGAHRPQSSSNFNSDDKVMPSEIDTKITLSENSELQSTENVVPTIGFVETEVQGLSLDSKQQEFPGSVEENFPVATANTENGSHGESEHTVEMRSNVVETEPAAECESDAVSPTGTSLVSSILETNDEKKAEYDNPIVEETTNVPRVIRLDVLFSFGLVTVQTDPSLEAYMNAVELVVTKAIHDDPNLGDKVRYDPEFKPFVKSTVWDTQFKSKSGRPDVKRMVVTASVPVFLKTENRKESVALTREGVVEALSAAIHTGSFLATARGKK